MLSVNFSSIKASTPGRFTPAGCSRQAARPVAPAIDDLYIAPVFSTPLRLLRQQPDT
ncbi:MAG: hypothetical protein GQF41_2435 [Candidatus Rifleibacterium amylolyticum]|nr:MAG: hypothetical protein GQF41_2435 [Candidatus Rifleibacterium amylolyticum]